MIRFSRNKSLKTLQLEFNDLDQIHMTVHAFVRVESVAQNVMFYIQNFVIRKIALKLILSLYLYNRLINKNF